jgi:hypothetical protein
MKTRVFVIAAAMFAGMVGSSSAFEGIRGVRTQSLVTNVSCDVRDRDDDKQAMCASKCEDEFISGKMHYNADLAKVAENKKACDEKCGCPQNSK